MSRFRDSSLFAKLFSGGLLFLFADVFKQIFPTLLKFDFFDFNRLPFFVAGVTICLISLLFLLTEWVILPYGMQIKRIKLYQGVGNLFAFAILIFGCLSENYSSQNSLSRASVAFSTGGLLIAVVFAWLGQPIAGFYSRKKIKIETLSAHRSLHFAETAR